MLHIFIEVELINENSSGDVSFTSVSEGEETEGFTDDSKEIDNSSRCMTLVVPS